MWLYAALLVILVVALLSDGTVRSGARYLDRAVAGLADRRDPWLLALISLRDKVIFLAARGEVYASLTVAFLFGGVNVMSLRNWCLMIWMGAATSKLTRHFRSLCPR